MEQAEGPLSGGEIKTTLHTVRGVISQIGNSRLIAVQY
jgi:hypothetical protein